MYASVAASTAAFAAGDGSSEPMPAQPASRRTSAVRARNALISTPSLRGFSPIHARVSRYSSGVGREPLIGQLERYLASHPGERDTLERTLAFVRAHPDCFERSCAPGHITGSAWILSHDRAQFLLTHHRKLGRWLQLGGHADGEPDPLAVALREAQEESGMEGLAFLGPGGEIGRAHV